MSLNKTEYDAALRQDFCAFIHRCFIHLHPQGEYSPNWHIDVMAAKLEACRRGETHRLIINLPPRYLKSICASVALPAWLLGHNLSLRIICVSYGQDLAEKHAIDCRGIMMSDWYQRLFSGTRLSPQKAAVNEFMTTAQGGRLATSVGGVLTGRGADVIIIDDPLKPGEALSDTERRRTNEWFDHTLYSRLNSKKNGCIIVIMQRLHQDDLVGHVLEQEPWEQICFPAIAEVDEEHVIVTPYGTRRRYVRKEGEALHPAQESLESLAQLRRSQGEYHFAGQYQQAPVPFGGGMIKEAWFKIYEPHQLPSQFDLIVQSWDTANKASELNNYSVCTTWGLKDPKIYLLHVLRKRLNYPELKRAVRDQWQAYHPAPTVILIEDKASGTQLIQELIETYPVKRYVPEVEKVIRMDIQTNVIENGLVYLPNQASWLDDYIQELTTFPKSKYSDQVDSTSQALDWIKKRFTGPGMGVFRWYQEEYERAVREGRIKPNS